MRILKILNLGLIIFFIESKIWHGCFRLSQRAEEKAMEIEPL